VDWSGQLTVTDVDLVQTPRPPVRTQHVTNATTIVQDDPGRYPANSFLLTPGVHQVQLWAHVVGLSSTQLNSTQLNSPATLPSPQTQTPSPQTQHKQKSATAATIVRNLPTHPQSRCTVGPNTKNKKQSGNGRIDYAEFSHGGHQIPLAASKNVLKTSFSKGELGIVTVVLALDLVNSITTDPFLIDRHPMWGPDIMTPQTEIGCRQTIFLTLL